MGESEMPKRHAVRRSQRSVVGRIEEIVLASSGADAFELVFTLVAARLGGAAGRERRAILAGLRKAEARWPGLQASRALDVPDSTLATVGALLDRLGLEERGDAEALDAVFEQLVTRVGKGEKGQFFTPRHVVSWIARALSLEDGERVVDPACGSGAFLVHARAQAKVETWGYDVDARAVRVARLIAAASGDDPARIIRADSLARSEGADAGGADVIMTNPPFAGDVSYPGYELARRGRRAERDTLFVERCIELLRPGGRLAVVLPHNKVAARGSRDLRRWLVERARVYAVVSLPRETFLPHTSQKAVVVFARRREDGPRADAPSRADERIFFAVSERAGKDAGGEALYRAGTDGSSWKSVDHDLDALGAALGAFLLAEGFARKPERQAGSARKGSHRTSHDGDGLHVVRRIVDLGEGITLAPERQRATSLAPGEGVALSSLAVEKAERIDGPDMNDAVVFDTTHARGGVLDVRAALRAKEPPSSAKKRVRAGDLLVSRLRPYLRQIAFVHPDLVAECEGRPLACSTEFYVLSPPAPGGSLAFLLPWLLADETQAILAAAQEGGHHPRVPRETLLALRVPASRVRARAAVSSRVEGAIAALSKAQRGLAQLIEE